jgi:hypothetical protein
VSLGLRVEIWPHCFVTSALYGWVVHVPTVFLMEDGLPVPIAKWAGWAQGESSVISRYDDNAGSPHAFLTEHWSAV